MKTSVKNFLMVSIMCFMVVSQISAADSVSQKELSEFLQENEFKNINDSNDLNGTPLFVAAQDGNKKMVEYLLQKGINPNIKNPGSHQTPLHGAAFMGNKEIIALLISKGADVNANSSTDADAYTPLSIAVQFGKNDAAKLLTEKGANIELANALYRAVNTGNINLVKFFLQKNANVNAKMKLGATPLHAATAKSSNKEIAELLLEKGADINAKGKNEFTPLHRAVMNDNQEMVEWLIKNGADVNAKEREQGRTPLYLASQYKREKIAEILHTHNGKTAAKDEKNWLKGGTLHKATVKEWNEATRGNKIATMAEWLIALENNDGTKFDLDNPVQLLALRITAGKNVDALDIATKDLPQKSQTREVKTLFILLYSIRNAKKK